MADQLAVRLVDAEGNVSTLRTVPASPLLAGDGQGNVVAVTPGGIDLLFGPGYALSARIVDLGARTVVGPLPTTLEEASSVALGNGRIYVVVKDSVFTVDL